MGRRAHEREEPWRSPSRNSPSGWRRNRTHPAFLGHLLVDRDSLDLAEAPPELMAACEAELEGQVAPEFLKCQIEIGSKPWSEAPPD